MFRDDEQKCTAIKALLRPVHLGHLWTDSGPTDHGIELFRDRGGPLSHGQKLMLLAAYDIWNGRGEVTLGDLLSVLDGTNLEALGSLMVALSSMDGQTAVDHWIAKHSRTEKAR